MINYDKLGDRFNAFKEIGEETRMLIASVDNDFDSLNELNWQIYDHQNVDGVGMIVSELEKKVIVKSVPIMKNPNPPGIFKLLVLFFRYMKWATGEKPKWKNSYDWNIVGGPEFSLVHRFSKADSDAVHLFCRENKISTTSFFLSCADQAFQQNILETENRKWVVPINIRGITDRIVEKRNLSVVCQIWLSGSGEKQFYIHQRIKTFLEKGLHWGGWVSLIIQSFLSKKTLINILDKHKNIAHGLFTNLGSWPGDYIEGEFKDSLLMCIPSSRLMPVSCLVLEFQSQIQLNLSIHPVLNLSLEQSEDIFKTWVDQCRKKLNLMDEQPIINAVPIKKIMSHYGSI